MKDEGEHHASFQKLIVFPLPNTHLVLLKKDLMPGHTTEALYLASTMPLSLRNLCLVNSAQTALLYLKSHASFISAIGYPSLKFVKLF